MLVSSLVLNMLSLGWYIDNGKKKSVYRILSRVLLCALQLGPLADHCNSFLCAYEVYKQGDVDHDATVESTKKQRKAGKRRRRLLYRMLNADRDAAMLRLFEAFLEAAPQLLVQTWMLAELTQLHGHRLNQCRFLTNATPTPSQTTRKWSRSSSRCCRCRGRSSRSIDPCGWRARTS